MTTDVELIKPGMYPKKKKKEEEAEHREVASNQWEGSVINDYALHMDFCGTDIGWIYICLDPQYLYLVHNIFFNCSYSP